MALVAGHSCTGARRDAGFMFCRPFPSLHCPRTTPGRNVPPPSRRCPAGNGILARRSLCAHPGCACPGDWPSRWLGALSAPALRTLIGQQPAGGRDWPRARPSCTTCSPRGSCLAGIKRHASGKIGPVYSLRQSWLPRPARHQAQTTVAAGSSAWQLHCR